MSQASDAALWKWLTTPPENRKDVTMHIRNGLSALGVKFGDVTWKETEAVVEDAIKPFRDEIERLRADSGPRKE